jgi:hypothetical protein
MFAERIAVYLLLVASFFRAAERTSNAQVISQPSENLGKPLNDGDISATDHPLRPPLTVTFVAIAHLGGNDRYGDVILKRGPWLLENITTHGA